jgi:hypothetical protein
MTTLLKIGHLTKGESRMDEQAKQEVDRKRYREFIVTPGLCGFKVKIGCSEVYFATAQQLGGAITDYLLDPDTTERKFQNGDIRRGGGVGIDAPEPTCNQTIGLRERDR